MAQVEIVAEREGANGWTFDVQVLDAGGALRKHEVALSWADYNLWSGTGADEPAAVAVAVVRFLLSKQDPDLLRPAFDASICRRLHADADERIPGLIHNGGSSR